MKMLLKYSAASKKIRGNNNGKLCRNSSGVARGVGPMSALQRHRKVLNRTRVVAKREIPRPQHDPCDNSNDSGLGFDHQPVESQLGTLSHFNFPNQQPHKSCWAEEPPDLKRRRPCDVTTSCDSDNANADFTFPLNPPAPLCSSSVPASSTTVPRSLSYSVVGGGGGGVNGRAGGRRTYGKRLNNIAHSTHMCSSVRDPKVYLEIVCQPEQQHRARYQTEGSRGAVKDRSGNGFPVVKLCGYMGQATLEVFIGTDQGKIAPHMFYQACRVAGKNSTPCLEKKQDGTVIIDIEFEPGKEMAVTCDCVGILKERNVDVEQRFPDESTARSKKKSTRCRMVFRTTITNLVTGETEMLQVASQPIVCTQPPGVPEICKKNISSCPVSGGEELWIFGKNFLKDTKVMFQRLVGEHCLWEQSVVPDKEFLQQIHLVCKVPPYEHQDIKEPVTVSVKVVSSNRHSEPQAFVYTPGTSHLWPTLSTTIKTEHLSPPCLMPPPTMVSVNPHYISTGGKQIETAPLSKAQNLDAIVNSAADAHILSSPTPTDSTNTQLLPQVTSLLTESSSQQQQIESQVRSLLTEPAISTEQEQQQLVCQVSSLLDEAANTQQQMVSQVSSLVIEAANNQQQHLVSEVNSLLTEAANTQQQQQLRTLLNESCTEEEQQQLESLIEPCTQEQIHNMITKPNEHLVLQQELTYPPTSTTACEQQQQQQLFEQINLQLQVQSQIQNMNESAAQQMLHNMTEASPPQLLQSMSESNPQQLIQNLNVTSPQQIMQTLSESTSPQQLMQNIAESNSQHLMQTLSESSVTSMSSTSS
uniref:Nuclear factor of activated T-cells 5 n=1 Tax=Cacopsylla melanoneura TaxID=428564 RepID=A0A8D9DVB3_9HEMI